MNLSFLNRNMDTLNLLYELDLKTAQYVQLLKGNIRTEVS